MKRTEWLQETRKMRFVEAYEGYRRGRLTQSEAALVLGVCDRTFRCYMNRYDEDGMDGLLDKRLVQVSQRRAPVDEVMRMVSQYRSRHVGWNAKHFYAWYRKESGSRSYTWVKSRLQEAGLIERAKKRGTHRKRRERAPLLGMLIHQDGSTHEWISGQKWDLIVTMDDATNEHYSMFFVEEEGTTSSFRGVQEVIEKHGLFASFYSDRGSHYWYTPEAGGKVDKNNLTQFGQALKWLGIEMIAAYSAFSTRTQRTDVSHASGTSTEGTGISRYYRYGGSQSLCERSLYACFQCRIYATSHGGRNSFRALDWRAVDGHPV